MSNYLERYYPDPEVQDDLDDMFCKNEDEAYDDYVGMQGEPT